MDLTKVLFNLDFFIDASAKKTPMGEGVHSSDPGKIYFQNDVHAKIIYLLHNLSPFQETDLLVDVLNCFDSNTILTVSFLMPQKGLKKNLICYRKFSHQCMYLITQQRWSRSHHSLYNKRKLAYPDLYHYSNRHRLVNYLSARSV